MATIEIRYKGSALTQDTCTVECESCSKEDFVFDVVVDGSLTVPNYRIVSDGPGLALKRVGNNVYATVPDNYSPNARNFTVGFSHGMSPSVNFTVYITQPGREYAALLRYPTADSEPVENLSIEAENLFNKGDQASQSWRVYVECPDGCGDFGVEEPEEYISGGATRVPYDGGLSVVKGGGNVLDITNYGRISMYDSVEYRIKVYHRNDRSTKKTISITYNTDTDSGLDFGQ